MQTARNGGSHSPLHSWTSSNPFRSTLTRSNPFSLGQLKSYRDFGLQIAQKWASLATSHSWTLPIPVQYPFKPVQISFHWFEPLQPRSNSLGLRDLVSLRYMVTANCTIRRSTCHLTLMNTFEPIHIRLNPFRLSVQTLWI